ncbi:UDP-glucose dehydrogenase family protein [Rothia nasimurium]|uniref:UDP-glucose dehydrogenase family protein n=1 Tax=Rothia nasimurium TaxID=85336 RepID=UPI001F21EBA4|nr:UDP-glucose/GDP-mannose dehydrogenase family protein [Rothia nasimurium]
MKIAIFGSGYVGLVTGACLADGGHHVTCVDIDQDRVQMLSEGKSPIWEPGLDQLLAANITKKRLQFTTNAEEALGGAEVAFIAVGTPQAEDGSADLKYVKAVATTIGQKASNNLLVVNKSTVPVGTAAVVQQIIDDQQKNNSSVFKISVCSNPEFLKEGAAINDFKHGERIVIGCSSFEDEETMRRVYEPFNRQHDKILAMDIASAELTKYAANAMLATKISFMNEMAAIAEATGADIEKIRVGIGSDSRIGYKFLYAGAGYGGSCFPKDVAALAQTAKELNLKSAILDSVDNVNKGQKKILFNKLTQLVGDLEGKTVAVWGLAFKPKTDDVREAPALELVTSLVESDVKVQAYDPVATENFIRALGNIAEKVKFQSDAIDALDGADALVICTEWEEFRTFDSETLKQHMAGNIIVDGRNLYSTEETAAAGFVYASVGRKTHFPA